MFDCVDSDYCHADVSADNFEKKPCRDLLENLTYRSTLWQQSKPSIINQRKKLGDSQRIVFF